MLLLIHSNTTPLFLESLIFMYSNSSPAAIESECGYSSASLKISFGYLVGSYGGPFTPVVLNRRLVPNEPEASQRLSTGLGTHGAPHMSQRQTTLCPPVIMDRRILTNESEASSHRLFTGLGTHGASHMSHRPTTFCPCSGHVQTARSE